jgi:hypothetical protein
MTEDERRTLYIAQRDKHLEQLMAINARAVFTVLALVVSLLVGFEKIKAPEGVGHAAVAMAIFFVMGVLLLTISAVRISTFHTRMIRMLEAKSFVVPDLAKDDFLVIPPGGRANPFVGTLAGVSCLILAILIPLICKLLGSGQVSPH